MHIPPPNFLYKMPQQVAGTNRFFSNTGLVMLKAILRSYEGKFRWLMTPYCEKRYLKGSVMTHLS